MMIWISEVTEAAPDTSWVWNLVNSVGVLGALIVSVVAAVNGRTPQPHWELLPGPIFHEGKAYISFKQLGPGVAESVYSSVRPPRWQEWTPEGFIFSETKDRDEDPIARGSAITAKDFNLASDVEYPDEVWRVSLTWSCLPYTTKRRSKTWRVQLQMNGVAGR